MDNLPSPSELPLLSNCLHSLTLPRMDSSSNAAVRGTIIHKYLADVSDRGVHYALEEAPPEMRHQLATIDLSRLPAYQPERYSAEVSFAYNPLTGKGRVLGKGLTREQARSMKRPGEMVGTADVVGTDDVRVIIYDYKTGWLEVDRAELNWQIRTYALMACRALGLTSATVGIIRVLLNAGIFFDVADMDREDLNGHEADVRMLVRDMMRVDEALKAGRTDELPPPRDGKWCRYCAGRWWCDGQKNMLLSVLAGSMPANLPPLSEQIENLADGEQTVALRERLKHARAWLDKFADVLDDRVRRNPVVRPDGSVFTEHTTFAEFILPDRAAPVLERRFGQHTAEAILGTALQRKTTLPKTALSKALLKHVIPTLTGEEAKFSATSLLKEVVDDFKRAGAVAPQPRRTFKWVKPKKAPITGTVVDTVDEAAADEELSESASEE